MRKDETFREIVTRAIETCYADEDECRGDCAKCYVVDNAVDSIVYRIGERVKDRLADARTSIEQDLEE